MTLDKIIPNLFIANYADVEAMPEEQRNEYYKIATLWAWEPGDLMKIEERYEKYQKAPWKEPLSNLNIVFSDPEAISMSYLDMEKLDVVALAIHHNLEAGRQVLVYCKASHQRSPTAIIRYLQIYRGLSVHDAEQLVSRQHEGVGEIEPWIKKMAD